MTAPPRSRDEWRSQLLLSALTDATFQRALAGDAEAAVRARFGPCPFHVRVHQEAPGEWALRIPCDAAPPAETPELQPVPQTRGQFEAIAVSRAVTDSRFLLGLRHDPAAVVAGLLAEHGLAAPAGLRVVLLEELAHECLLVLPALPPSEPDQGVLQGGGDPESVGPVANTVGAAIAVSVAACLDMTQDPDLPR